MRESTQPQVLLRLSLLRQGAVSGRDSTSTGGLRACTSGVPGAYDSVSADAHIHLVGTGDSDSYVNQLSNDIHQWNIRDTFSLQHIVIILLKFGIDRSNTSRLELNTPNFICAGSFFYTHISTEQCSFGSSESQRSHARSSRCSMEFSAFAEGMNSRFRPLLTSLAWFALGCKPRSDGEEWTGCLHGAGGRQRTHHLAAWTPRYSALAHELA